MFNSKPAFDADGDIIHKPRYADLAGKYDWSTQVAKQLKYVSPRTLEALAGNMGGDVYRLGGAATSNDSSALGNALTRSIFPKDNTGLFFKDKFEDQLQASSARLREAIETYGKESDHVRGYQEAFDIRRAAEADAKRVTSNDGYSMSDIIQGMRHATSDQELSVWKTRRAELDINRQRVMGNAMIRANGIENALRSGQYESGVYEDGVYNRLNRVNTLYDNPEFQNVLINRIK